MILIPALGAGKEEAAVELCLHETTVRARPVDVKEEPMITTTSMGERLMSNTVAQRMMAAGFPSAVLRAFHLMGIAEEEISKAKKHYPGKTKELDEAFLNLCPAPTMMEFSDSLYRAFVVELLDQVGQGQQRMATNAEAAMTISMACLKAPIQFDFAAAYWLAMCEMFGEDKMLALTGEEPGSVYTPKQIKEGKERLAEVKATIAHKLSLEKRK